MKAMAIEAYGGVDQLKLIDMPTPVPEDNEVLISIEYAGVNPVDWKIREGKFKTRMPYKFPLILGWDAAGVVTAKGKKVTLFEVGDEVFACFRKPIIQMGTYAEFITFEENNVAHKPKNISFAQAAGVPLVALTAWQALFDVGKVKKGDTVLIHAGAGGVGGFAIQFAKNIGAKVVTTASKVNHDYVQKLGASEIIDYKEQNVTEACKKIAPEGFDFVFDTVGGQTLKDSLDLVKKGGTIVSIVEQIDQEACKQHGIQSGYVFVRPDGRELNLITKEIEQGKVVPLETEEIDIHNAVEAQEKIRTGHTKGKIVLKIKGSI